MGQEERRIEIIRTRRPVDPRGVAESLDVFTGGYFSSTSPEVRELLLDFAAAYAISTRASKIDDSALNASLREDLLRKAFQLGSRGVLRPVLTAVHLVTYNLARDMKEMWLDHPDESTEPIRTFFAEVGKELVSPQA